MEKKVQNKFAPKPGERLVTFGQSEAAVGRQNVFPEEGFGKRAVIEDVYSYDQGYEDDTWGQDVGNEPSPTETITSNRSPVSAARASPPNVEFQEPEFIPSKTFKKDTSLSTTISKATSSKEEVIYQHDPDYSPSDLFMTRIKDLIEKNNFKEYKIYLQKIPLKNLTYEKTNKLLLILLKWLEASGFTDGLKLTLKYWSGMQTGFDEYFGELYPVIPVLFLDPTILFSALNYIMKTLSDVVSVEEVAIELFEKGADEQLTEALKKLFDILGAPTGETYRILYDEALKSSNETAIEFFSGLQSYFTEAIQKPAYVVQDEEELLDETLLLQIAEQIADSVAGQEIPSDDVDACVALLLKGFQKFNLDVIHLNKTREYLKDKLENLNEEERVKYVYSFINQDVLNQLVENINLFNIMGPSNPITNGDFTQTTHICYKYGGCRMFYCNCFEAEIFGPDNDDSQEPYYPNIPQWFTGKCQHCKREIEKRCYAIRRPLPQGGWRGTYCSWNCLTLSGNNDDEMSREKCTIYENQLFEKTIMNRNEMNVEEALKEAKELNPEGYVLKVPNIG